MLFSTLGNIEEIVVRWFAGPGVQDAKRGRRWNARPTHCNRRGRAPFRSSAEAGPVPPRLNGIDIVEGLLLARRLRLRRTVKPGFADLRSQRRWRESRDCR